MAKRFTDTELWDKEWFMQLSCTHKCLIRYLFDKCDAAGIWQPNWLLASTYVGEKISGSDLSVFKKQIEILPDGKVFIVDFIEFQYGELSENCAPHRKVIQILKKYSLHERVAQGYCKGIITLKEKEEDKEEEKDILKGGVGGIQKFTKPDESILTNFFCEIGLDDFSAQAQASKFLLYYDSTGWKIGGKATMKDWKAAARNWKGRINEFKNTSNATNQPGAKQNSISANANAFLQQAKSEYDSLAAGAKDIRA